MEMLTKPKLLCNFKDSYSLAYIQGLWLLLGVPLFNAFQSFLNNEDPKHQNLSFSDCLNYLLRVTFAITINPEPTTTSENDNLPTAINILKFHFQSVH